MFNLKTKTKKHKKKLFKHKTKKKVITKADSCVININFYDNYAIRFEDLKKKYKSE